MATTNAYGAKSKQLLWHQTIKEKTLQYINQQGKELKKQALIVSLDDADPSTESLFLARAITESGIRANLTYFSIPEKEILFVAEQITANHIVLFSHQSLTQKDIKNLSTLAENLSMQLVLTGASSTVNQTELKKSGIKAFTDHQQLISHLKEI